MRTQIKCRRQARLKKGDFNIIQLDKAREASLKILYNVYSKGAYSNIALNKHFKGTDLSVQDRAFATELVYGVIKWQLTLDYIIERFSNIKLKRISPWILNILRLGVYQLIYTDKVPISAACNESVNLSKRYGHKSSSGYVNAVLRNVAANRNNIEYPDPDKDYILYLSVKYSHPIWLVRYWSSLYGKSFTEEMLKSNNSIPELTIRVNSLKISNDELASELKQEGLKTSKGKYMDDALILNGTVSIADLEAYKKGYFVVQDESSMLAVKVLDPKPGEVIADPCSAPGGKSTYIAQLTFDAANVIARDIHPHKIKLVNDIAGLLGLNSIHAEVFDSVNIDERLIDKADRVIVDAPCSGLGIIRRKADIKWTRKPEDIKALNELQYKILDNSARYVKRGGVLLYSTCTIFEDENQGIVEKFLHMHPEFKVDDITDLLPKSLNSAITKQGYVQLFPHIHNIDGFFIARLKKLCS